MEIKKYQCIRVKLKSFDYLLLSLVCQSILIVAKESGAVIKGPIYLPTHIEKFTIMISPHVNKTARDQYEIKTHKRLINIMYPSETTIDLLMKLDINSGVDIQISLY